MDHHYLEVIVCFVDFGGIVDHHSLVVIVGFVDFGGIVDHHCVVVIVQVLLILVEYLTSLFKLSLHNKCPASC